MQTLVSHLDRARGWLLRRTMRAAVLRHLYGRSAWRLGALFLLSSAFYLPVAVRWPDLLLVLGPFFWGYAHLVSSYWLVQTQPRFDRTRPFHFFAVATLLAFLLQLLVRHFAWLPEMPFGAWEVMVSAVTLLAARTVARSFSWREAASCLIVNFAILRFAWSEPVLFVGGVLLVHNWIAFLYWILSARTRSRRMTAIGATFVFGAIHALVFAGALDGFFPPANGIIGWYLASWSEHPVVWYRALVLYAYGISLHYFVWLKAIPESLHESERPHPFRRTWQELRTDLGPGTVRFVTALTVGGMALWAVRPAWGTAVYFGIASLHGWIEVAFLIGRLPGVGSWRVRRGRLSTTSRLYA